MHRKTGAHTILVALIVAVAFLATSNPASGEETKTTGRSIQHVTKFEATEISEDHFIATFEAVGVTLYDDGVITTNQVWGHVNRINGAGVDRGFMRQTWSDGSTTVESFVSEAKPGDEGVTVFSGTFEYTEGTGQFKGITGEGSFHEGKGLPNGMIVVDWEATMEVPTQ